MNTDRFLTRVWDKQEKKMLYPRGCNDTHFLIVETDLDNDTFIAVDIPFADRFIPMRCTGKKDTNNKLIYADDIITFYDRLNDITERAIIKDDEETYCYEVVLLEDIHRYLEGDHRLNRIFADDDHLLYEIIGNIHEHTALLEEKK